jgi:hypothetical protein
MKGSIVALVTPMLESGEIRHPKFARINFVGTSPLARKQLS